MHLSMRYFYNTRNILLSGKHRCKVKVRKLGGKSPYVSAVWTRQPVPLPELCQLGFKRFTEEKRSQSCTGHFHCPYQLFSSICPYPVYWLMLFPKNTSESLPTSFTFSSSISSSVLSSVLPRWCIINYSLVCQWADCKKHWEELRLE